MFIIIILSIFKPNKCIYLLISKLFSIIKIIVLADIIVIIILRQCLSIVVVLCYTRVFIFDLIGNFTVFYCCYCIINFISNNRLLNIFFLVFLWFIFIYFILLGCSNWSFIFHDSIWIFIEELSNIWITP